MSTTYTYQDLLAVGDDEKERINFVNNLIHHHKMTDEYKEAVIADEYNRHKNVTINEYQKILYTVTGKAIPDNFSANFKMACRHFHRFIVQENQFLLGNGISFEKESIEDKLGTKKYPFDNQLQELGKKALIHGVSFGFFDFDHLQVFTLLEFIPLYDEENGALMAGVRFWQIDKSKPLRATLYEIDGYTHIIWKNGKDYEILQPKTPYRLNVKESIADGAYIYGGENYPTFPIIPLWGNPEHQSELIGLREQIDCYDLIKSGFANNVDEASLVYWTIQNAGGMDDVDLAHFVEKMKTVHAAVVDDGATAESHSQDAPFESREALLDRLDKDLYRDAMALDIERIASGAVTATQIKAAYEPLNSKCDEFEYCVRDFIQSLLELTGNESDFSFTRSMIVNSLESVQTIVQAAQFLSPDYVTEKILDYLGDGDRIEDVLNEMSENDINRFTGENEDDIISDEGGNENDNV